MIEAMLGIILLIGGYAVGSSPTVDKTPDKWKPADHNEMLRQCGLMCGEGNLKKYNINYGSCECRGR